MTENVFLFVKFRLPDHVRPTTSRCIYSKEAEPKPYEINAKIKTDYMFFLEEN